MISIHLSYYNVQFKYCINNFVTNTTGQRAVYVSNSIPFRTPYQQAIEDQGVLSSVRKMFPLKIL